MANSRSYLGHLQVWGIRALAAAGLLAILVVTTPAVVWLMPRPAGTYDPPAGDTLVVLGAGTVGDLPDLDTYWRCVYAVRFFRSGSFQRIVVSGGTPRGERMAVAAVMAAFFETANVPAEKILVESRSRSTRENALFVHDLLRTSPQAKVVLLTSDYHTRRAGAAFQRAGVNVAVVSIPYVEKLGSSPFLRPMLLALEASEYAKSLWYRFKGWT